MAQANRLKDEADPRGFISFGNSVTRNSNAAGPGKSNLAGANAHTSSRSVLFQRLNEVAVSTTDANHPPRSGTRYDRAG